MEKRRLRSLLVEILNTESQANITSIMRFVFMYFFFGDESKIDSIFSLALYGVKQENVEKIESLVLDFIKINSLPKNYELRYHSDSSLINQKFRSFIIEKLELIYKN